MWSECRFDTDKYIVTNPIGNLDAGNQYTVTIIEKNQKTSSFSMPTAPKRMEVSLIYSSELNLQHGDVYQMDFEGKMNSFSVSHKVLVNSWDNMIGVTFNPKFTLSAASLTTPIT